MSSDRSFISIVSGCYNEVANICPLVDRLRSVMEKIGVDYEIIFIDNCSVDGTQELLRGLAQTTTNIRVIFNEKNFGAIRSPFYGMLQAKGDAVVLMASDLEDPPELIPEFIQKWREGASAVLAVKQNSTKNKYFELVRIAYYKILKKMSDGSIVGNATGFGLYDQKIVQRMKEIDDPYPFLRGLVTDLTSRIQTVPFTQQTRVRGKTKSNFYDLYDIGSLGLVKHSRVPLRAIMILGGMVSIASFFMAITVFVLKLLFWNTFYFGLAPILIGVFFLAGVQLLCIGVIGEYIGSIHTQVRRMPLVVEHERLNFPENKT